MYKLLFISFLLSLSGHAIQVSCEADYELTMPSVEEQGGGGVFTNLYEALSNREYDPCEKIVEAPKSKEEYCAKDAKYFQNLLCMKSNRMGFNNNKGLFGLPTGVCWWHSQFHRAATYQAYYNPDKPKIDLSTKEGKKQMKDIVKDIRRFRGPVEVPGYSNLKEFTQDPEVEKIVQKELQKWMGEDSFVKMQWVNGLTTPNNYSHRSGEKEFYLGQNRWIRNPFLDDDEYPSEKAKERALRQYKRKTYNSEEQEARKKAKTIKHQNQEIEELFEKVQNDQIGYITTQYPGVMAHAQLVFDARKYIKDGKEVYEFKIQDSNFQNGNYDPDWKKKAYSKISFIDGVWYMQVYGESAGTGSYEEINIKVHKNRQLKRVDKLFQEACGKSLFATK